MPKKSPGRRPPRANFGLTFVEVNVAFKGRRAKVIGFLFAITGNHMILLNNIRERADIGSLKKIRWHHINPEADITVFPGTTIKKIRFLS